jgi:hypothetical protein
MGFGMARTGNVTWGVCEMGFGASVRERRGEEVLG